MSMLIAKRTDKMPRPAGRLEVRVRNLSKAGIRITMKEIKDIIDDYSEKKLLCDYIEVKVVSE